MAANIINHEYEEGPKVLKRFDEEGTNLFHMQKIAA
jgi:hypothetical protein